MKVETTYAMTKWSRRAMLFGPLAIGALNMLVHGAGAEQVQDGLVRILGNGWDGTPTPTQVQVFGYDATGGMHPISDIVFKPRDGELGVAIQGYSGDQYARYRLSVDMGFSAAGHNFEVTDAQLANGPVVDNHIPQGRTKFNNYTMGFLGFMGAVMSIATTPLWLPRVIRGVRAKLSRQT